MFPQGSVHFNHGGYVRRGRRLNDEEYGLALDSLVKACGDFLLKDPRNGKVLLGKRKVFPQPDFWFLGGRMQPVESPEAAASRSVKRELGIEIAPDKFITVAYWSGCWSMRQQQPQENGTADISCVMTTDLTPEQCDGVVLSESEYNGFDWVHPKDIAANNGRTYHPALRWVANALVARESFLELQDAISRGASDAEIAEAARKYAPLANPDVSTLGFDGKPLLAGGRVGDDAA